MLRTTHRPPQYVGRWFVYLGMDVLLVHRLPGATIAPTDDPDRHLANTIARERRRLGAFIRRSVADPAEAEDILRDVLAELGQAWSLAQPIHAANDSQAAAICRPLVRLPGHGCATGSSPPSPRCHDRPDGRL